MPGKHRTATKKCQAITKVDHHRSQPASVLKSNGVIVMNGLNGRHAKGGRSAEVNIRPSFLSPPRETTRERKQSPKSRNVGIHARTSDRNNIHNQVLMRSRKIPPRHIPRAISRPHTGFGEPPNASPTLELPPSQPRFPPKHEQCDHGADYNVSKDNRGYMVHKHGDRRPFPEHGKRRGRGGGARATESTRGLIASTRNGGYVKMLR
jgi:hypothetical protein